MNIACDAGVCGIYLLTCHVTGRKYVGQSENIPFRIRSHSYGTGRGPIGDAIRQHGWESFSHEVLEDCAVDQLNANEAKWIAHLACMSPSGYNGTPGGGRSDPLTPAQTTTERQARSRALRASTGGKQIAVMLTPAAAAKLAAWVAKDETIASIVNKLLTRSKP